MGDKDQKKKNEKLFFCHTMYNFDHDVTYDQEYHNLWIKIRGSITKNKSYTSYGQQQKIQLLTFIAKCKILGQNFGMG
jgi:hypothetical protein